MATAGEHAAGAEVSGVSATVDPVDGVVVPTGVDALPGATGTEQETSTSITSGQERKDCIGSVCTPNVSEVLAAGRC